MEKYNKAIVGTHWGNYLVETRDGVVTDVKPTEVDANPSQIGQSLYDMTDSNYRISQPMVRAGYLRGDLNHHVNRGKEPFVPVSWEEALDLAATALQKTKDTVGNAGIFGGSYGWSSAGRFHHAQSQVHRFLNLIGGYTASISNYSHAAAAVIIPHVLGVDLTTAGDQLVKYDEITEHCDLFIAFGGVGNYNLQVLSGGIGSHNDRDVIEHFTSKDIDVISVSPMQSDTISMVKADWVPIRPCTDVALMLGLAHYLEITNNVDSDFIEQYTVGYDDFKAYLLGHSDGVVKDFKWTETITGLKSDEIKHIAEKLINASCPLITVSQSLQRAEHGEQTYWMAVVLAAMLGSLRKTGGGVGLKWGSNGMGITDKVPFQWGKLSQGVNPVSTAIPVARITDMLLNPGDSYHYNGEVRTYPDIQLIYWAGGNPFHHHQDLNRLRHAWQKPETVIVNESVWTATARFADIVFPVNTFLERNDIICGRDLFISPSKKVQENFSDSRSDYEIFCGLSERLGVLDGFSEGRNEMAWVEKIYQDSRDNAKRVGMELPTFEVFWADGKPINLEPQLPERESFMKRFCSDPDEHPLPTPSGKIEISSRTLASFGYADCGPYPQWFEKSEWLGAERATQFPLHMISPQPRNKLHSQLDFARFSRKDKTNGRETVTINPTDAKARGIKEGMIVRLFNDRGTCLAGAHLSGDIMPGVISLPTGAWYCTNEEDHSSNLELHGNPNVLTPDLGTSSLAQGPIAHSCLVDIEPYNGSVEEISKLLKPKISSRTE